MSRLVLWATFCLAFAGWITLARAEDPALKQEIQELKASVLQLQKIVEAQNAKIEKLEQSRVAPAATSKTPHTVTELQPKTNPLEPGEPGDPTNPIKVPQGTPLAPQNVAGQSQEYRQIGFWKVPVDPNSSTRFIPNISVNGVFSGAYFTQDPEGPTGHNPSRTGFNLQEIELAIQSIIDPYIRADIFLSFLEDGVELEEAYITTLSLPKGLQVKAGQYLLPFGRQNPKHIEQWPFVDNMLVNQELLGPEGFDELGFEVSYLFPTPFYLLAQGNMTQGNNEVNFDGERKADFAYTGRLSGSGEVAQDTTLLMGASAAFGWNNTGQGNATNLYGGDLLLSWRPSSEIGIDWQTEYMYRRREVPYGATSEGGLYSYVLGNWSKRWGAGLRVDYMGIPRDIDKTFRLSPMIAFRTTEWFHLKAQYDFTDDAILGTQHAAFLQWIFTMGPHGPHPF